MKWNRNSDSRCRITYGELFFEKTPLLIDSARFLAYGKGDDLRCCIIMGSGGMAYASVVIVVARPIPVTNTVLVLLHPYTGLIGRPATAALLIIGYSESVAPVVGGPVATATGASLEWK